MFRHPAFSCATCVASLLVACSFFTVHVVAAQEAEVIEDDNPGNAPTVGVQGGRYGVGFASSWPAYGVSGTLQLSETLTAQAVLGFLGAVTNLSARGLYRFRRSPEYDIYAYGAVGAYRYGYFAGTESVLGVGGGGGIEAGLQRLFDDEDFPPIFVNAEVGLGFANFEYYNFSAFVFGAGVHYRFGGN